MTGEKMLEFRKYGPAPAEEKDPTMRSVWNVVGPVPAHGTCRSCGHWHAVGELVDAKPGGRRDAPSGLCQG